MYDHHGASTLNPLWAIAIILIVAALYWLRVLAAPMTFSLFLMALVWPVQQHRAFKGRRALRGLALIVSVLLVLITTAAVLLLIGYGARIVADGLSQYGVRTQETYHAIGLWLEGRGVVLWPTAGDPFSPNGLFHLVHEAVVRINAIMGFLALTLIFLIMGLLEASAFQNRLPHALGADAADRLLRAFHVLGWKFRRYMIVRSAVSVLTGLLTWIFALLTGLVLAIAWGILAFALNYIPFVGSILAVFPPVLFAIVQFESWQTPVLILLGMTLIQFSIAVWLLIYHHVREQPAHRLPSDTHASEPASTRAIGGFLTLTLLAMLGLGAFEVGLSLQARQSIGLDPFRVGLLFTACSLVMLAVQLLWSAHPPKRLSPGDLIGGAFLLMAMGILGLPYASSFWAAFVVVGLLGAGSGLLIPLLAYQVSLASGPAQGAALGKQTALASLGQAVGSAGAGLLFVGSALGAYWGLAIVLFVTAAITFVVHYRTRVIAMVMHAPRQD